MTVDWSINIGHLVTIVFTLVGFAGGAFGLYFGMKGNINKLGYVIETQGGRIINVETEMRAMRDVLTEVAVQDQQIDHLAERLTGLRTSHEAFRAWAQERITKLENHGG